MRKKILSTNDMLKIQNANYKKENQSGKTILVLGNGFDLSYSLPTKYACFLNTMKSLLGKRTKAYTTVGSVFADITDDPDIANSYKKYKEVYDACELDQSEITSLTEKARNNAWYSYFNKTILNNNAGWIDFEKEVAYVIDLLKVFFDKNTDKLILKKESDDFEIELVKRLVDFTKVFSDYTDGSKNDGLKVQRDYLDVKNKKLKKNGVKKDEIIAYLGDEFQTFSEMLNAYLKCFVEKPMKKMKEQGLLSAHSFLPDANVVITFNYTSTYETICSSQPSKMIHIHGSLDNRIVLGINPGKEDELDCPDTSFIRFKKYHQRSRYDTEGDWIKLIWEKKKQLSDDEWHAKDNVYRFKDTDPFHLFIYGHSLDVTDKDILKNLFEIADAITILYYDESAKSQYITNLIRMFGKEQFDDYKLNKQLIFVLAN